MKPGTSSKGLGAQGASTRPFHWEGFDLELVREAYRAAFRQLSRRERRALRLVEVKKWPYRKAAERLDLPTEQLRILIFQARKKIQRRMKKALETVPKPS